MKNPINTELELVTVSFRARIRDSKIVARAAEAKGLSKDAYVTQIVIPWAYSDLGLELPADYMHSTRTTIAQAAARRGLSVREFTMWAARELALTELADELEKRPEPRAAGGSHTRLRAQR